jgi:hypothetical protein
MTGLWDRSDEYEPLPTTPFLVIFGLPILVGLVALGVAVRRTRGAPQGAGDHPYVAGAPLLPYS